QIVKWLGGFVSLFLSLFRFVPKVENPLILLVQLFPAFFQAFLEVLCLFLILLGARILKLVLHHRQDGFIVVKSESPLRRFALAVGDDLGEPAILLKLLLFLWIGEQRFDIR